MGPSCTNTYNDFISRIQGRKKIVDCNNNSRISLHRKYNGKSHDIDDRVVLLFSSTRVFLWSIQESKQKLDSRYATNIQQLGAKDGRWIGININILNKNFLVPIEQV